MANPTLTAYCTSGDGFVRNTGSSAWSTLRAAASGTSANHTSDPTNAAYNDGTTAAKYIDRGFFAFDLSSIPAGADIVSATLSLYCTGKDSGAGGSIGLVEGTQASTTALATSDFSLCGSTEFATRKTFSGLTTSAYNDFALNASGLAYVKSKFGSSAKFCFRGSFDLDNSAPGTTVWSGMYVATSEHTGTSQDPKLVVVYTLDRAATDAISFTDGGTPAVDEPDGDRQRWAADAFALADGAAPFARELRQPVLVRAEGANTQLNGAQTMSSGTITVDSTTGFPSAGTFYSYDALDASKQTAVTYTGKTATTFTGCTGGAGVSYSDNSPIGAADAESHFPSVNALDDTATPRILVSYTQHSSHAGGKGRLMGKVSSDGGQSWGTEQTIRSGPVSADPWAGCYGHTALRLEDGTLYVAWYEQDLTNRVWIRSYSVRGTPDGNGWFTFDTPVEVTSPFHADSCAVGFHAFEDGGYLYQPVYGTDNSPYITYVADSYVKLLRSADAGETWTTVGTIATEAQLGGYEGSECSIVRLASGTWRAFIRQETSPAGRLTCTSTDQGATWTGHTSILSGNLNDPAAWLMPEGHIVVQGQSGGGPTVTYVSLDNGATFPYQRDEESDPTYSISNGGGFYTIADTSVPGRRVLNAYAQERASQGGAQTKFQWYAVENFPVLYDEIAFTDTAVQHITAAFKTGADSLTFTDAATRVLTLPGAGADTLSLTDTATSQRVTLRDAADALAWTDAGARTSSTASKTGADTVTFTDTGSGTAFTTSAITIHPQGMVPGTAIAAYLRWEWRGPVAAKLNAGPGAAVAETTVSSGLTATFALAPGEYVAYSPAYPTKRLFFMVTE